MFNNSSARERLILQIWKLLPVIAAVFILSLGIAMTEGSMRGIGLSQEPVERITLPENTQIISQDIREHLAMRSNSQQHIVVRGNADILRQKYPIDQHDLTVYWEVTTGRKLALTYASMIDGQYIFWQDVHRYTFPTFWTKIVPKLTNGTIEVYVKTDWGMIYVVWIISHLLALFAFFIVRAWCSKISSVRHPTLYDLAKSR